MTTYDPGEVGRSRSIDSGIPATGWRHLVTASDLTGRLALAGAIAVGLAVPLIWVAAQFYAPIDHDTGAILYFSDRWWAGERLYVDLIDVNPPLVFILGLLPVLIRQWTGLPEPAALIACVAATSILSTFVVWRLLAWRAGQLGRGEPGTLTSILVPLALLFALLTPGELGQREHLMVVLTVPYVVLTALRLEGRRVPLVIALGIAMAAAAGFALKPFFLLVPALIELFVLWVRRGQALRDPVPWTMGAMWAAYVGLTLLAFPEYGDVILPMTLEFYSRLGDSSPLVAFNRGFLPIEAGIGVLAIVTVLMVRSRLCQTLALFAIGTAITTIVQGKGWSHQWLHADLAFILLGAAVLAAAAERYGPTDILRQRRLGATLAISVLAFSYVAANNDQPPWFRVDRMGYDGRLGRQIALVDAEQNKDHFLALSPGIYPFFPMVNYTGTRMASPYMSMWVLQGVYKYCPASGPQRFNPVDQMSAAERRVYDTVSDGLVMHKPTLVVIDRIPGMPTCDGKVFDYLAYFMQNSKFAAEFMNYDMYKVFDRYIVYRRR
ncbi:hypothetical protein EDC65_4707 [Stella humosa]|uniref:4-amino-4-deoxy-L-arabinose transferase-like glycosyltransferase n=1 Tax=Stella humosa TaxID=94 RepID=A0A3N1KY96_9PROT|nr:hypothetical protein [Stella humosa]ROP83176.1 hypothetical protein EDC65_4707 [Stella humosa]BBK30047.1 hypothetical protein STHU_06810 [Stella humosa]